MAYNNEFNIFIDPETKQILTLDGDTNKAIIDDQFYSIENGVIDFYNQHFVQNKKVPTQQFNNSSTAETTQSPELREAHDNAFSASENAGENGNIYGSIDDLPKITQSGHYRRMEILAEINLGNIEKKVVVDFGTGPWGFGAIFPQLRQAKACIGFDVSKIALLMARNSTPSEINTNSIYATADGDFIPLADNSVDIFFGGEVIEHVRSPMLFLQEISRVCKDNALVILTTPNRDALNYKIFQQPYCVGPEHIALMNYNEFKNNLEKFCNDIIIIGYEISLSYKMDHEPIDESTLEKIQARSEHYPELSTGMVSVAKVNKKQYLKNRRPLTLNESLWNSKAITYSTQQKQAMNLFDNIEGVLLIDHMAATIAISGQYISLLFWGHSWSGIVEITCGTTIISQDLYSEMGGFIRVDIDNSNLSDHIILNHTGQSSAKSHSDQVIFFKIIEYNYE